MNPRTRSVDSGEPDAALGLAATAKVPPPEGDPLRADLHGRWKTMQLLRPVFELTERAAPRAGFDHRSYDLAQLALRAVDFVVIHQASVDGAVTADRILDHLTNCARRMAPSDPGRPWSQIARQTLNTLLNDGRPHEAVWHDLTDADEEWSEQRRWRFRLLRLVDGEEGAAITATDEAIVLYLQALNTDLADRALALKLLVEVQMQAGEFDKALGTARQATRTAQGLAASLRERLDDTRRDVRAVDWQGDMPAWLSDVLDQLGTQLERDSQLKDLAVRSGADPDAAPACRAIVAEVRRSEEVWLNLESRLQQAIPVYLAAQESQRFAPRGLAATVDLETELLDAGLRAEPELSDALAECLTGGLGVPEVPPQWSLDDLLRQLLRPPVSWERADPVLDDPGELADAVGDSIPDAVAEAAAAILGTALVEPRRLSALLDAARAASEEVADDERLAEVVWGAALYTYVADGEVDPDTLPRRADLAAAVTQLVAVDDGARVDDARFEGPDLLLATPLALDLAEHDALISVPAGGGDADDPESRARGDAAVRGDPGENR